MLRTAKKNSGPIPQSKASRIESPLMWGIVWARLVKLGFDGVLILDKALDLDKALVLNKALDLDKALDLRIVNPIRRASNSVPTVRCWVVSWSDNHEGKHPYPTLCESVYVRNEKTNGLWKSR